MRWNRGREGEAGGVGRGRTCRDHGNAQPCSSQQPPQRSHRRAPPGKGQKNADGSEECGGVDDPEVDDHEGNGAQPEMRERGPPRYAEKGGAESFAPPGAGKWGEQSQERTGLGFHAMDEARPEPTSNKRGTEPTRAWRWWCRWLGVTACILIAGLWVTSVNQAAGWKRVTENGDAQYLMIDSGWIVGGRIALPRFLTGPPGTEFTIQDPDPSATVWWTWPWYRAGASESTILLPLWLALLACALPTGWLFYRERVRKPGVCATCGYDLTANVTGVCPECGTTSAGKPESTG